MASKSDSPNMVAHLERYVIFNVTDRRAQPVSNRPWLFLIRAASLRVALGYKGFRERIAL